MKVNGVDVAAMTLGESPYTSTTVGEETTDTAVTAAMTTINKHLWHSQILQESCFISQMMKAKYLRIFMKIKITKLAEIGSYQENKSCCTMIT